MGYRDTIVGLVERGLLRYNELLENEPPTAMGTFLDKNARLLSLLGFFRS